LSGASNLKSYGALLIDMYLMKLRFWVFTFGLAILAATLQFDGDTSASIATHQETVCNTS
jgi:hypothetical protein